MIKRLFWDILYIYYIYFNIQYITLLAQNVNFHNCKQAHKLCLHNTTEMAIIMQNRKTTYNLQPILKYAFDVVKKLSELGLFTLHNCGASCSLDYLQSKLKFKSRHSSPEFSGSLCSSSADFTPNETLFLFFTLLANYKSSLSQLSFKT